jgi:hypothetical protein
VNDPLHVIMLRCVINQFVESSCRTWLA